MSGETDELRDIFLDVADESTLTDTVGQKFSQPVLVERAAIHYFGSSVNPVLTNFCPAV